MKKIASVLAATAIALPLCAQAEVYAFVAMPLTPTQETTKPNSAGHGSVTALYDSNTKVLLYSIVYKLNADSTATAAHFHGPAALGANAGVRIGLPTTPTGNAGKVTGTVTLTAAQEAELLAGQWYFNLHSTLAGGGELRSQLLENSASLVLPTFVAGKLTLPVVLLPGRLDVASYSAGMEYAGGDIVFHLTEAAPLR